MVSAIGIVPIALDLLQRRSGPIIPHPYARAREGVIRKQHLLSREVKQLRRFRQVIIRRRADFAPQKRLTDVAKLQRIRPAMPA